MGPRLREGVEIVGRTGRETVSCVSRKESLRPVLPDILSQTYGCKLLLTPCVVDLGEFLEPLAVVENQLS